MLRDGAAAAVKASISCMSSEMFPSFSGCHCTPATHQDGSFPSKASISPSGARRRHAEVRGELADPLVVVAVDPDLARAVNLLEPGARLHDDGVAVRAPLRVAVRDALGHVLGQVEEDPAAGDDVQLLHAQADAQHGHPALLDELAEQAVRRSRGARARP